MSHSPRPRTTVIIPVLNEEQSLPYVLDAIPAGLVDDVVVVDNGSTDRSAEVARRHGARVVHEPVRGYGSACLAGIDATVDAAILVFLDGDRSDFPEDLAELLPAVVEGQADMVIGSRMVSSESRAALLPQARFGNRLASVLLRLLFGIRCTDLGPFRVIRRDALLRLGMKDRNYGWTVEMQVRARFAGLRVEERPVRYRERIGRSKITGTLRGTLMASYKIIGTILAYRLSPPRVTREQ